MDTNTYLTVQLDIQCGKYDCLKGCCVDLSNLSAIHGLMRRLAESDLPKLQVMLCGCAYPKVGTTLTPGLPSPATPFGGTGVQPTSTVSSCGSQLTAWVCAPGTHAVLSALDVSLSAASIVVTLPVVRVILGALSIIISDLMSGCDDAAKNAGEHAWSATILDKLCGLKQWVTEAFGKFGADLNPIGGTLYQTMNELDPATKIAASCCVGKTVSTGSLPDLTSFVPSTPVTTPSGPPATTTTGIYHGV